MNLLKICSQRTLHLISIAIMHALGSMLTSCTKAQLSTHHSGVHITPSIISHCAPDSIEAHLNTTFIFKSPAHQPDITMTTRT